VSLGTERAPVGRASHKDVAQQFNDRRLHHKSEAMVDLLGEISAEEHAVGRPCSAPLWFARTRRFRSQGRGFYRLAKELGFMSKGEDKVELPRPFGHRILRLLQPGTDPGSTCRRVSSGVVLCRPVSFRREQAMSNSVKRLFL